VETLRLDVHHRLRSIQLELALDARPGETLALVGPSGAGKSTVLRIAAGLVTPDGGTVALGDVVWLDTERGIDLPPEQRSVGLVFQDYALFPHLDVRHNVAFGGTERVDELLARFRIAHLAGERPTAISGGERQRVALARALARNPKVLLLDEPLSALDTHTRATVRGELRDFLHELDLPTIIVTHDFEDAAVLADRVGVLVAGTLLQQATPDELVASPADAFVATFTGANVLYGSATLAADGLTHVVLDAGGSAWTTDSAHGRVALAVHPWEVSLARETSAESAVNHIHAPIGSIVRLGNRTRVRIGPLTAEITTSSVDRLELKEGEPVFATFKATATRVLAAPSDESQAWVSGPGHVSESR
jgi:ABC-type sulfate/molybdate transport systems ATPase subunit